MRNDDELLAELFCEFSELSASDRATNLEHLRDEMPELARELESLLSAYDASGDFLKRMDTQHAADLLRSDEELAPPEQAGAWRLVREIGRGGLGVVYLGERTGEDFKQLAAVKLIKRGMDSEAILNRFLNERRILASLDHPNIARLIDGGLLDDGRPYFAMDYIEGVPITIWCDSNKATIEQRLKLFEQACRAVQYAHAKLIVHRDLKPGNMLVQVGNRGRFAEGKKRPDGGRPHVTPEGQVKLLDFGIAKLLDDDAEGSTLTTAGVYAMTPEYAAPEQILGQPINTATDVYALGMVLYELLTGHHPYRNDANTREELARAICDTSPTLPSAAVSGEHAEATAAARASRPALLRRRLNGDLDNIVLKAMAREPERRYGSAEALAEDVHRHLQGEPVMARHETAAYRARLFMRRHRVGLAATAAVILALAGGMSVALWQAREARLQEHEARSQAAAATAQAERAEQVSDFLTELFRVNDPAVNRGEQLTARELLERGAERIDSVLDGQPDLQAHMAGLIGRIHLNLGEYDHAVQLLDRALALHETLDDRIARAKLLRTRAYTDHRRGDYRAALLKFDEAETLLGPEDDPLVLAWLLNGRGLSEKNVGEFEAAESSHRRALELIESALGPDAVELGPPLNNLALLYWRELGRREDARPLLEHSLDLYEQHHGKFHPYTLGTAENLGWLLSQLGEFEQAEVLLTRALEGRVRLYGEDSEAYATALLSFANFQSDRGNKEESIRLYHQVHELYKRHLGPDHDYVAFPLQNIGNRHVESGNYFEAVDYYDRALAILRPAVDAHNPRIAQSQFGRAKALAGLNRLTEARDAYAEALEIRESLVSADHPQSRRTRLELLLVDIALNGADDYAAEAEAVLASYPEGDEDREDAAERLQQAGLAIDD